MLSKKTIALTMIAVFSVVTPYAYAAQVIGHVTGTFADSVHFFGPDHKPIGQIKASEIINQPIVGKDPKTGLYAVQTSTGLILVKPGAVQTDIKSEALPVTPCLVMNVGAMDTAAGSSNNLAANCSSR